MHHFLLLGHFEFDCCGRLVATQLALVATLGAFRFECNNPLIRNDGVRIQPDCFARFILSRAAFKPAVSLPRSSLAQKCMKNKRG